MTDFPYPPFDDLNWTRDELLIGASAMRNLRMFGYLDAPARAVPQKRPMLPYVGVLRRNGGFAANYRKDGRSKYGPRRCTPEEAALDRARLLGRDYIEMRGKG